MRLNRADIRQFWPKIKDHIVNMLSGYDEQPEEVYAACRYGQAHLFISEGVDGFVILKEYTEEVNGKKVLFIWFAYKENDPEDRGMSYMEDIEAIARHVGAEKIKLTSTRKGMERYLGPNWKVEHTYEKAVTNG